MKILIAAESPMILPRIATMIENVQDIHILFETSRIDTTLNAIQSLNPDIVLVGLRLEDGSGIEVLKEIRTMHTPPTTILLSSYSYPTLAEKSLDAGADYFINITEESEKLTTLLRELKSKYKKKMIQYTIYKQPRRELL